LPKIRGWIVRCFILDGGNLAAPEEIRTPDPQIRSLGASTLKSPVEADPITSAARPHSRITVRSSIPAPGSSKSAASCFGRRPALACEVGHAPSRRMAEAGFKDSVVKKLACLPRIRPAPAAPDCLPRRASLARVSLTPIFGRRRARREPPRVRACRWAFRQRGYR
jgi:hypothetical protein